MSESQALEKTEAQLETIIDKNGNDKTVARAADGKFASRHRTAVKKSLKDVIRFFESEAKDSAGKSLGKTRHEAILDKLFEAMMSATGEDLVGLSKAYAELQKAAYGTKGKDRVIEASDPENNAVKVILITTPQLPSKEVVTSPSKPSFVDAEIISTNPPGGNN